MQPFKTKARSPVPCTPHARSRSISTTRVSSHTHFQPPGNQLQQPCIFAPASSPRSTAPNLYFKCISPRPSFTVTFEMAFVASISLRPQIRTVSPSLTSRSRPLVHVISPRRAANCPINMSLEVGNAIPTFSLPINGGNTLSSSDLGDTTILYFYPRDATSGCTVEAQDFRDMTPELEAMGVKVIGVSKDSVESHDKFVADLKLPFPLISDDGTLCEAFGVWKVSCFSFFLSLHNRTVSTLAYFRPRFENLNCFLFFFDYYNLCVFTVRFSK